MVGVVGPILNAELLVGSRRGRLDRLRYIYAVWLILQFLGQHLMHPIFMHPTRIGRVSMQQEMLQAINGYLETLIAQHFILMALTVPAFAAGAIADEKTRGTLQYLLTAHVSGWEIVIGKLLGRLAQVGLLAMAVLPFFALVAGYGELLRLTALAFVIVSVAPLFALGGAGILAAVWSTRTRDAVLRVYVCLAVGLGIRALLLFCVSPGGWLDEALRSLGPLHVLDAAWNAPNHRLLLTRLFLNVLGWGLLGAGCVAVAVWRLRPAYEKQLESEGLKRSAAWMTCGEPPWTRIPSPGRSAASRDWHPRDCCAVSRQARAKSSPPFSRPRSPSTALNIKPP
jgi:ABC-type transport system involved in multi-copper enzyme maturation permease subunit